MLALAPRALPAFKSRVIDMFVRNYYHVLELLGEGVGGRRGAGAGGKEDQGWALGRRGYKEREMEEVTGTSKRRLGRKQTKESVKWKSV